MRKPEHNYAIYMQSMMEWSSGPGFFGKGGFSQPFIGGNSANKGL